MQTSYNPRPLKQVFNQDNAWEHYLEAHPDEISDNQIEVIEKMLACNTRGALGKRKLSHAKRSFLCSKPNGYGQGHNIMYGSKLDYFSTRH